MNTRNLLYFTLSEIKPRVWFMLTGCTFRCKGCFRPARDGGGTTLTTNETLELMDEACLNYYGLVPREAMITGGEPTLNKGYLLELVAGLRRRDFEKIVLMTNGYLLGVDEEYVRELEEAGLTEAHVDLKAFSETIHRFYTGQSNTPVLRAIEKLNASGIKLLVQTIYMPGIVDESELEKIARFLASVNKETKFRINPFAPLFAYEEVTRRPTLEEMERAYNIASKYLPNAIISRSCYRESPTSSSSQKTWITVYPDLSMKRRGLKDQAEERLSWLNGVPPRENDVENWQKDEWDFTLWHDLGDIAESPLQQTELNREEDSGPVTVKFPGALDELTKTRMTELDFNDAATVEDVLKSLLETYGDTFRETVMAVDGDNNDGVKIKRSFNVYLNGMNITNLQGLNIEVRGTDEIIILSWLSGG